MTDLFNLPSISGSAAKGLDENKSLMRNAMAAYKTTGPAANNPLTKPSAMPFSGRRNGSMAGTDTNFALKE